MSKVLVINGPNLNLLGGRETAHYGTATLADLEVLCRTEGARLDLEVELRQSNHEGELIDWLHEAGRSYAAGELIGVVLNPGAYSHTSIALHDAIRGAAVPVIECHISNVFARESFRQHSYISPVAAGVVIGFGVYGYVLALAGLRNRSPAAK